MCLYMCIFTRKYKARVDTSSSFSNSKPPLLFLLPIASRESLDYVLPTNISSSSRIFTLIPTPFFLWFSICNMCNATISSPIWNPHFCKLRAVTATLLFMFARMMRGPSASVQHTKKRGGCGCVCAIWENTHTLSRRKQFFNFNFKKEETYWCNIYPQTVTLLALYLSYWCNIFIREQLPYSAEILMI
jgi:hypothetical protein